MGHEPPGFRIAAVGHVPMHPGYGFEGEFLQGILESLRGFFYGIAEGKIEDIFLTVLHLELGCGFEHLPHP